VKTRAGPSGLESFLVPLDHRRNPSERRQLDRVKDSEEMRTTIHPWIFLTGVFHIPPQKMGKSVYRMRMSITVAPATILRYVFRDSRASGDASRKSNRGPADAFLSLESRPPSAVEVDCEAMAGRVSEERGTSHCTAGVRCLIHRQASRKAGCIYCQHADRAEPSVESAAVLGADPELAKIPISH